MIAPEKAGQFGKLNAVPCDKCVKSFTRESKTWDILIGPQGFGFTGKIKRAKNRFGTGKNF